MVCVYDGALLAQNAIRASGKSAHAIVAQVTRDPTAVMPPSARIPRGIVLVFAGFLGTWADIQMCVDSFPPFNRARWATGSAFQPFLTALAPNCFWLVGIGPQPLQIQVAFDLPLVCRWQQLHARNSHSLLVRSCGTSCTVCPDRTGCGDPLHLRANKARGNKISKWDTPRVRQGCKADRSLPRHIRQPD